MITDRARALVLHGYSAGWRAVIIDTWLEGVRGLAPADPRPATALDRWMVNRYWTARYEALSYAKDWLDAFLTSPALAADACNINDLRSYGAALRRIREYDLVVALHSATGDSTTVLRRSAHLLRKRRGPLVVFIGNEFDLLASKKRFLAASGAEFVGSQLPLDSAEWLYGDCAGTTVLSTPHALNPRIYRPDPAARRDIDVGFVGALYGHFIGDTERTDAIRWFERHGGDVGLNVDIRFGTIPRADWAAFLRRCRAVVGAESGTYFLDREGDRFEEAKRFTAAHPAASARDIFERFFAAWPWRVSGKAISSRHFEPVGTKTCQILVEGRYNDILVSGEHYIPLRRDLSNVGEAMDALRDEPHRESMAERAYDHVLGAHTYDRRVADVCRRVLGR